VIDRDRMRPGFRTVGAVRNHEPQSLDDIAQQGAGERRNSRSARAFFAEREIYARSACNTANRQVMTEKCRIRKRGAEKS
jgi:hypothetical protein